MYSEDMPLIRDAMRADMEVFRRGVMFAVLSMRQKIVNVPDQMGALFEPDEDNNENPLFGHKWQSWEYISNNSKCASLWSRIKQQIPSWGQYPTRGETIIALSALLEVPGLGIVKGAFILQLMGFNIACLDGRNAARLGRSEREFETSSAIKARPVSIGRLLDAYVGEFYGEASEFWNAWCEDVAATYGRTPDEISRLHLAIIPHNFVPF